jgi:hypothetical protein
MFFLQAGQIFLPCRIVANSMIKFFVLDVLPS